WVNVLAPACPALLSWRMRRRFSTLVQRAGLEDTWRIEPWFALRIVLGVLTAASGMLVASVWPDAELPGMLATGLVAALPGFWWPDYTLVSRGHARRARMLRELPF